ncbi:MAG: flavodoxin family protein [Planctomycetota bacterium]|jgi:NAD(P)H dehydrogenase (quinone)
MATIAIVYHSGFGHTKQVAQAVEAGAKGVKGVSVRVFTSEEAIAQLAELDRADAIVFGSPTYMGGPSASFKAFADATSKKWLGQAWKDKLAGGFTNSGSYSGDKLNTLQYFVTLAMQHGMIWVGQAEPVPGTESGHGPPPDAVNRLGSSTGVMTQSDHASPENAPSPGDLRTGELYGQRVAQAVLRWVAGGAT